MTVIIPTSIAIILACKFSKSPTQTSTLSPMENECPIVGSSFIPIAISKLTSERDHVITSQCINFISNLPSGCSSNLSNSASVGLTPSACIADIVKFLYKKPLRE